jgi:D-arginine dehydrogenase
VLQEVDFLVVGAGIAGASVAAELARHHRTLLVERESRPGYHSTGRSAALHSEIYGNAPIRALTRASRGFFLQPQGDRAPFATPRGCLHIATAEQLDRLDQYGALPDVAAAVTRLDADAVRQLVPVLRPGVIVAGLSEHNAYDLDVDAIHHHYLRLLRSNGSELACTVEPIALSRNGHRWEAELSDGRRVAAAIVINAAGAWSDEVAALVDATPIGLQPMRRTAALIDAPTGLDPSRWPAVIDIGEQFYFKPDAGRLLLSPADEIPTAPCDAYPDELDVAIAVERIQQVADIEVTRAPQSWAGLRTFAPDRTPVVGFDPQLEGFFWLAGQGGYGIQTAPALSRAAAALALGRAVPEDVVDCGFDASSVAPQRLLK